VPTARACELLSMSRSGYYRALHRPIRDDTGLQDEIEKIVLEYDGYGYRRVTAELRRRGHRANHKRVLRIMRERSWLCRLRRQRRGTTQSNHGHPVYPNLIRGRTITGPNQVWMADITYIRLPEEFVFLAAILDLYSRRVIGWELSCRLDVSLTLTALNRALASRPVLPGLIHHSDQGIQYAAGDYVARAQAAGLTLSMSRRGRPLDNAHIESFFRTLKMEQVYLSEYRDLADARRQIASFIDEVYNRKRLHSALGYLPPVEFEQLGEAAQKETSAPVPGPSALLTRDPVAPAGVVYVKA
jgi:putative transposase